MGKTIVILMLSLLMVSCSTQCNKVNLLDVSPMVILDLPERPTLEETNDQYSDSAKAIYVNLIKLTTYAEQLEYVIQSYNEAAIAQNMQLSKMTSN